MTRVSGPKGSLTFDVSPAGPRYADDERWRPPLVEYRWIGGEYFRTLDVPLLLGRLFDNRAHSAW